MSRRPVVLLHGYSDSARGLGRWKEILGGEGYDPADVHLGEYVSLSNEITIKDIAEGFDRALREQVGLKDGQEFDAIVHSTGGLVIREWLATYPSRRTRVKHIVGLAPAMFGSPLAHKGRSWLGAIFKGEKGLFSPDRAPDFLEAGTRVLSGLEMGSSYTWQLAERDLLGAKPTYGKGSDTPYPFVFIGVDGYGGLRGLFTNPDGSDGTVRWAAAGMNIRKLHVDLRQEPGLEQEPRVEVGPWSNIAIPLVLVEGCNHGTILSDPPRALVNMVVSALEIGDMAAYEGWAATNAGPDSDSHKAHEKRRWQQFVIRAVDERGDPVPDYFIELGSRENGEFEPLEDFALEVHPYTFDPSYRCFHVNLRELAPEKRSSLRLRLIAESGTALVAYYGYGRQTVSTDAGTTRAKWDAELDLTSWLDNDDVTFFAPSTTTLVEIQLNREPMPPTGVNEVLYFVGDQG